jgi:hypothetical protein
MQPMFDRGYEPDFTMHVADIEGVQVKTTVTVPVTVSVTVPVTVSVTVWI